MQTFIKLSAAVHELSWSQKKTPENKIVKPCSWLSTARGQPQ